MKIRAFRLEDENAVISLWQECGLTRPWNDPGEDIERKLTLQPEGFLVALEADAIVGTVMAGYDGHRGWVNYLAVAPGHRRKGYGRALMQAAEEYLQAAGAPKVNLQVRDGNDEARAFYKSLGYEIEERVSFGKRFDPEGG